MPILTPASSGNTGFDPQERSEMKAEIHRRGDALLNVYPYVRVAGGLTCRSCRCWHMLNIIVCCQRCCSSFLSAWPAGSILAGRLPRGTRLVAVGPWPLAAVGSQRSQLCEAHKFSDNRPTRDGQTIKRRDLCHLVDLRTCWAGAA